MKLDKRIFWFLGPIQSITVGFRDLTRRAKGCFKDGNLKERNLWGSTPVMSKRIGWGMVWKGNLIRHRVPWGCAHIPMALSSLASGYRGFTSNLGTPLGWFSTDRASQPFWLFFPVRKGLLARELRFHGIVVLLKHLSKLPCPLTPPPPTTNKPTQKRSSIGLHLGFELCSVLGGGKRIAGGPARSALFCLSSGRQTKPSPSFDAFGHAAPTRDRRIFFGATRSKP